jgi:hypothetical protein
VHHFFGLTHNDKKIFLEQIFLLMYYMGFTYVESYSIPIWQRRWFITRLNDEIKKSKDGNNGQAPPTHAAHQNTPDARAMMGRYRSMVPANLRRFT